jgi:Protein of unknown function (DUF1553)/Protein of unknown function (DUF1549)/Planctomycete cytochrome C
MLFSDRLRIVLSFLLAACVLIQRESIGDEPTPKIPPEHLDFFESKVRPLLIEHCYECHSVESGEANGELLIDSAVGVQKGGAHGRLLVPGKPDNSLLMRVVNYRDRKLQMPPDQKLSDEAIEILRHWIEIGAPDPREATQTEVVKESSPLDRDPSTHWAFNPPRQVAAPAIADPHSALDPMDAFAAQHSTQHGVLPNPLASRETLVRRLYFDMTGIPPSYQQIQDFVQSDRPDAYSRVVDSLLASPEFGERFGRHWLDVARYADTIGYGLAGRDRRYADSEKYRDWTILAFASDMPYDEMLRHQLAGDRTDPKNEHGHLHAMGFLTLGREFLNPLDTLDDRIDVISRGLLAMTVTCARCHDHKFDPIPTSDYYSLGGILFSSEKPKEAISPLMLVDKPNPVDSPVLIRGQQGNHGPVVPRQFLTALRKPDEPRFTDGSGRWELVQRITAPDNPLTARVMVNRLWAHLIGSPLVDSPSDFGFRTQPPAVPEILDDLAVEFSSHWSIKRIVRRIVLSRIYRQTAEASEEAITTDPDNVFLARANRKRRDFESLRDSTLLISQSLDRTVGGAPSEITLETPSPRRTVYAMIDRQNLPALFRTFDFASPDAHSSGRYFTTVPQQALFLLNNRQMIELARRTGQWVEGSCSDNSEATQATTMFRHVLGRDPSQQELQSVVTFLQQPPAEITPELDPRALWSYGIAGIDAEQKVLDFKPLPVFKNNRWQGGSEFPTQPPLGHAYLSSEDGHAPNDKLMAVVRRFTAPFAGEFNLQGQMGHRNENGDGVRASIWLGDQRLFLETQKKNDRPYGPLGGHVEAGQVIDFVMSPGDSSSWDSFYWRVGIQLVAADGRVLETESAKHFSGPYDSPTNQPLSRLAQLAQALLMSNEFAFVD